MTIAEHDESQCARLLKLMPQRSGCTNPTTFAALGLLCSIAVAAHPLSARGEVNTPVTSISKPSEQGPCLAGGEGFLRAHLSGTISAELNWKNARLACTGSMRPDGSGIRLKFSETGKVPNPWVLVFGIAGVTEGQSARALPANLTLIREGTGEFFGTQGDGKCTVDELHQTALTEGPRQVRTYRLTARGFCTTPARAVQGTGAVLVTRFDFTGKIDYGG
jgi:hypothetical protein